MSTISTHKGTAKSALRETLATYGYSGFATLLAEVLTTSADESPGRPTVEDAPRKALLKAASALSVECARLEERAAAVEAERARPKRRYTRKAVAAAPAETKVADSKE